MKERFEDIDFLRGVAIFVIIATHVYGLHLNNPRDFAAWNWLHFVVPGFIFCSGFVLAANTSQSFSSVSGTIKWLKKRFLRLLVPYYVYFCVHFALFLLFPNSFNNFHFIKSLDFMLGSVVFTGGVGLSWLPVLFIELTLLFPILYYFQKKNVLFYFNSLLLILISLITIFQVKIPFQNLTHWIFWLFPFILGMLFTRLNKDERKSAHLYGMFMCLVLFLFLYFLFAISGRSLIFTHHKYPPDLFYLSFALGVEFFILLISAYLLKIGYVKNIIFFFSKNSYRIFFVHYIALDIVFTTSKQYGMVNNAIAQSILVIILTVVLLMFWDKSKKPFLDLKPKISYK